jgi:hypothetical protein
MKKVFQTIIDPNKGNCMQAAFASIFELELDEVPNFIEFGDRWFSVIWEFVKSQGYKHIDDLYNGKDVSEEFHIKQINKYKGVNGFFYCSVGSPKYFKEYGATHAVIVNKDLEIVHDPSPVYQDIKDYPEASTIGYHGIRQIWIFEKIK